MAYLLYDFVDTHRENVFLEWTLKLQKRERTKLTQRLDMLELHGEELFPLTLAGTSVASIFKLKVQGPVKLRPLLCRGPVPGEANTYTLLAGAKEVGSDWQPKNILNIAQGRRHSVAADPTNRRVKHGKAAE